MSDPGNPLAAGPRPSGAPGRKARPDRADSSPHRRRGSTPDLDMITDTAAQLFHDRGYQNTTMQDLAEALGIAKPTLYSYTRSKAEILGRIFDRVLAEADTVTNAAIALGDPLDGLRHMVAGQVRLSVAYRAYLGLFHGDQRELPANLRKKYQRWSHRYVNTIRELVARGQDLNLLRTDLDSIVVAYAIIGMTNWAARWLRPRGPLPVSTVADELTAIILDGVRPTAHRDPPSRT